MELSLIKIRSLFPHFNQRPLTADDFWRVVESDKKLTARSIPLPVDGYYTSRRDRHFILINSKLTGLKWLHTAFHELHHYLFDVPGENDNYTFYRKGEQVDRREYKADAFALIAIMPWPDLMNVTADEVEAMPELGEIVRDRIVVRTHFGQ